MQTYLKNLLPRIQQYSQTLDKKELLVDQPWVLVDENNNKQQYIFERDGKLIMSLNGKVQYGNWKYIPAAQSLLIDRAADDSLLLNHEFFTEGVCILKKDGFLDQPWMLVNQRVVPDLNIQQYLKSLLPERRNFKLLPVKNAVLLFNNHNEFPHEGNSVTDDNYNEINGTFEGLDGRHFYEVKAGRIKRIYEKKKIRTDRGILIVEVRDTFPIRVSDNAYLENGEVVNGLYSVLDQDFYIKSLSIEYGKIKIIKEKPYFMDRFALFLIGIVVVGLIILYITFKS